MPDHIPPPTSAPDFSDDFRGDLDQGLWLPAYLPHWTTPERAAARYAFYEHGIQLRIEDDQLDWRPEDAPLRVSHLQTANFSGPVGSRRGTHRHRPDGLTVRTETRTSLNWAPVEGRIDISVSASRDADCMLAVWLVGTEHLSPDDSGEVCVFEIDAPAPGEGWTARTGIKAHSDGRLSTDMATVPLGIDAGAPHTWTAIWGQGETIVGLNGRVIRRMEQAPSYPLALMIDLFEIGPDRGAYPKIASVHTVRGWSRLPS